MKPVIQIVLMLIVCASASASTLSPYSEDKTNVIKSLQPEMVEGLLLGKGLGFAKTAELNQYPGPRHVLDLAEKLHLSNEQITLTRQVFESMQKEAINLGTQLVDLEKMLDRQFADRRVTRDELNRLLLQIGTKRAELRGTHLLAHVEMRKILNPHQIMMYDQLRGYSDGSSDHSHSH